MVPTTFCIPNRDKGKYVARCLQSALDQCVDDFELVISDQGSEDESRDEIKKTLDAYNGKKTVKFVLCPHTERRGMPGLNAHLNWLHDGQMTGELIIMCSADDYVHPQRVERTRAVYEAFNPSYINTRLNHERDGKFAGETVFPDRMSRWIAPAEMLRHMIGSSGSGAWAADLWAKYGPLIDMESQDVLLPALALLERGLYYLDEPLHTYCWLPSMENTGLMSQQEAAKTPEEVLQTNEIAAFHMAYNWFAIMRRWYTAGAESRFSPEAKQALQEQAMNSANQWALYRAQLSMQRLQPKMFRA